MTGLVMRKDRVSGRHFKMSVLVALAVAAIWALCNKSYGYSDEMRRAMMGGPWEIVVQNGTDGSSMKFPIRVPDENKVTALSKVLPLMGSPTKIRLKRYLPDLKWNVRAVDDVDGAIVARLRASGRDLNQDIWLSSSDPARRAISSRIGGVILFEFHNPKLAERMLRELTDPDAVGILSIWNDDPNRPKEYVIRRGQTITMSESQLQILDYMPHYSIDTKTKKVVNQSASPVNPAVKVLFDDGQRTYEQWLWSKFPSSPHAANRLPLRAEFTDFDLGDGKGKYILVGARGTGLWVFYLKHGKKTFEEAKLDSGYPFADTGYFFSIEQLFEGAVVKTDWTNASKKLLHPAIVAEVEEDDRVNELVLEFGKPEQCNSGSGTIVLLYRRKVSN